MQPATCHLSWSPPLALSVRVRKLLCPLSPMFAEAHSRRQVGRAFAWRAPISFRRQGAHQPSLISIQTRNRTRTRTPTMPHPFPVLFSISYVGAAAVAAPLALLKLTEMSPIPSLYIPPNPSVYLEFISPLLLASARPPLLRGTVGVRNIAYEKHVAARFTIDGWTSVSEVLASPSGFMRHAAPVPPRTLMHSRSFWLCASPRRV
jgi:Carbohydrate/starch-binding module (family 21)